MRRLFRTLRTTIFVMVAIGTLMLSATLNVSASEAPAPGEAGETEETGKLRIACTYSSDITPDEEDTFTISYVLTGLTDVSTLEVNASEAADGEIEVDVPYGVYNVVDITYDGNNEDIEAQGYGTDLIFQVVAGEDPDVLQLAVGNEAGSDLESAGDGVLAKIRGYIVNSFDDQPMEGSADSTEEEAEEDTSETEADDTSQDSRRDDEKQGETVYYDEDGESQDSNSSPFKKAIPLLIAAGIVAIVIFIMHKTGRI